MMEDPGYFGSWFWPVVFSWGFFLPLSVIWSRTMSKFVCQNGCTQRIAELEAEVERLTARVKEFWTGMGRLQKQFLEVIAERDAAFALSKCECGAEEACRNLVEKDQRIAELEWCARGMVEIQASGGKLDGYRELAARLGAMALRAEAAEANQAIMREEAERVAQEALRQFTQRDQRIAELEAAIADAVTNRQATILCLNDEFRRAEAAEAKLKGAEWKPAEWRNRAECGELHEDVFECADELEALLKEEGK